MQQQSTGNNTCYNDKYHVIPVMLPMSFIFIYCLILIRLAARSICPRFYRKKAKENWDKIRVIFVTLDAPTHGWQIAEEISPS